ncbi:MAG: sugar phosphate isomerase/epimerase [Chloroflexota bacterium]|nr:sugar phosphate isomerase/epimerase [Chloroflexia bacterium]MDQ3225823.1 sugar phosphate isomerase/epimerase [Chloroflexota bacterium]
MEIGLYAESAGLSSLAETLPRARDLGITRIELSTGGQNAEPFVDVSALLESEPRRRALLDKLGAHGMSLSALNISAFPLHPTLGDAHTELTRQTMRLAGELGVDRIIAQSGAPGDAPESSVPNWVTYPWPDEMRDTVRRQWEQAIALWRDLADYGKTHGVSRICFELHPVNLVYNVPTLLMMREAVGDAIGANFDPSHLMWQGMDIPACVRAIGPAVFHVHIKDVMTHPHNQALVGVVDNRPDVTFRERPWTFCTPGFGHDARWWREFFVALADIGYDDVASIENEDPYLPGIDGVERTVSFLREVM